MAHPLTRREAKERTRKRLLDAARELILAGGETRLAASTVAKRARVGGATFYEHFRSRDDLLKALADELFDAAPGAACEKPVGGRWLHPTARRCCARSFRTPLEMAAANP